MGLRMLARDMSFSRGRGSNGLTARQVEVLELVASGRSNREIALLLRVSENGVKAHVARLLVKFGVPNRAALVHAACPKPVRPADSSVRRTSCCTRRSVR